MCEKLLFKCYNNNKNFNIISTNKGIFWQSFFTSWGEEMNVWLIRSDVNRYGSFSFKDQANDDKFFSYSFNGTSLSNEWNSIEVTVTKMKGRELGHILGIVIELAFSGRVIDEINDLIKGKVELLPLSCNEIEERFFILNVVNVLDCIDYENADVVKFPGLDIVSGFNKYAFHKEIVENETIFKIKELPKSYLFVTDIFKNKIEKAGFTGLLFEKVWYSED